MALKIDPETNKEVLIPMAEHLVVTPSERVAQEEHAERDVLRGKKAQGAAWYMTHNTQVSIATLALGATWGIGTLIMLFYNGVMMGAIALDYIQDGQVKFLAGWLLPHGSVEIPALLLAGQAGLVLASALIGWGRRTPMRERLRQVSRDLVTLIFGVAILLTWAGIIEAFLSQYHEPAVPYSFKIAFGCVQLVLVVVFLSKSGRPRSAARPEFSVKPESP
jgi:uncharacterized membrane protein SpoIIM required for sporulation